MLIKFDCFVLKNVQVIIIEIKLLNNFKCLRLVCVIIVKYNNITQLSEIKNSNLKKEVV